MFFFVIFVNIIIKITIIIIIANIIIIIGNVFGSHWPLIVLQWPIIIYLTVAPYIGPKLLDPKYYLPVLPFSHDEKDKCKGFKLSYKKIQRLWFCKYHWQCSGTQNIRMTIITVYLTYSNVINRSFLSSLCISIVIYLIHSSQIILYIGV